MEGRPTNFWGKLDCGENGDVSWHPLVHHCIDVAVCVEALCNKTLLGAKLAHFAGIDSLDSQMVQRLAALAMLHDVGKFFVPFQIAPFSDGRCRDHSHVKAGLRLLDPEEGGEFWIEKVLPKLYCEEKIDLLCDWIPETVQLLLLRTILCHHGALWSRRGFDCGVFIETAWRDERRGLCAASGIQHLFDSMKQAFPAAFANDGKPLPDKFAFVHAFGGLLMMADWIASDRRFFEFSTRLDDDRAEWARMRVGYALKMIGFDVSETRTGLPSTPISFNMISGYDRPRPAQRETMALPLEAVGSVVVVEAETGSGKTEAAVMRFLRLFEAGLVDGMYFALPTRTAAKQIFGRVVEIVRKLGEHSTGEWPAVIQAVPGYIAADDRKGVRLPKFEVLWAEDANGNDVRFRFRGWAAEHPKRYLGGAIVVGTIDQVLLSVLRINHSTMRGSSLLRHLLVVDEVHASDTYMTYLLVALLKRHVILARGHAYLMSATLTADLRDRLLALQVAGEVATVEEAIRVDYPLVSYRAAGSPIRRPCSVPEGEPSVSKCVQVELKPWVDRADEVAQRALVAADAGACVVVIRNTVGDCLDTQGQLEKLARASGQQNLLFSLQGEPVPHHSRYATEDRQCLDERLEEVFGKTRVAGRGCVVVATQTIQQSLDIDADFLITDMCPMDVLLQRIGRLHRHFDRGERPPGFERASVVVLTPIERDLTSLLPGQKRKKNRNTHGFGTVYVDLRSIEATWRVLEERVDFSVPRDSRFLIEKSLHPAILDEVSSELGEAWSRHWQDLWGRVFQESQLANECILDWSQGLERKVFVNENLSERILTRLGENDRQLSFKPAAIGPFGIPVHNLIIPAWMAKGLSSEDDVVTNVERLPSGFRFSLSGQDFSYDRLGLRREYDNDANLGSEDGT